MYQKSNNWVVVASILMFFPGEMIQFDLRIFSDGVVQPPTSNFNVTKWFKPNVGKFKPNVGSHVPVFWSIWEMNTNNKQLPTADCLPYDILTSEKSLWGVPSKHRTGKIFKSCRCWEVFFFPAIQQDGRENEQIFKRIVYWMLLGTKNYFTVDYVSFWGTLISSIYFLREALIEW